MENIFEMLYPQVYVGDQFCGVVIYCASKSMYTLSCNGAVGQKVWIYGDYSYLTLCEVKVYGEPAPEGTSPDWAYISSFGTPEFMTTLIMCISFEYTSWCILQR